ncbi:hypothetical protein, partial [Methanosarcina mazei]|uniref:hypothetical protein n=1 Tax=Methanosarcina mazei TaxID=2209 RepID=UPI000B0C6BAA
APENASTGSGTTKGFSPFCCRAKIAQNQCAKNCAKTANPVRSLFAFAHLRITEASACTGLSQSMYQKYVEKNHCLTWFDGMLSADITEPDPCGVRSQNEKMSKQSKSGRGGKREGAGAPSGNTNAVKHGERSKRAFFPLEGGDDLPPLVRNRVRNLLLAECLGEMRREGRLYSGRPADWREQMLIEGMMWQHTR